jgi:23S rRNA maturation-related 3'-5' exoribonuclease YhaM
MNSYIKTGPISKALYKDKELELAVSHHLLKMKNATIRRLMINLYSFLKAEKDRLYRER